MKKGHFLIMILIACFACTKHDQKAPAVGEFVKIYDPSVGEDTSWYINDHCFIYGDDQKWHMFGITHEEPASPLDEIHLAHATANSLTQKFWKKQPHALSVDSSKSERHLWAPYVIKYKGKYYMYYCAGDEDHSQYRMHLATSDDLWEWKWYEENPLFQDGYDARDPFILNHKGEWIMYYTATDDPTGGHHVVAYRTSDNLLQWSDRKIAYQDSVTGTWGGPCESPFVQKKNGKYYLFLSLRNAYSKTEVLVSETPYKWNIENKVFGYEAHASEVVQDLNGEWYVSHCGWGQGGLYLAAINWND